MTTGTSRRTQVQDSLKGSTQVQPAVRQAPNVSGSATRGPSSVLNTTTAQTLAAVQQWAGNKVNKEIAAKQERSSLEGQVAYQQGKTFEEVDMEGDKYALQGYRVMQAQTAAASILAQQQAEIEDGGYEKSPEEFRAGYGQFLEDSIQGLDATTAEMVRETMTRQMPQLVQAHMTMHLQDQENKAFSALATSIDIMSKDDTVDDELFLNALGGEDAPSSGLSPARRKSAVVEGIRIAFENDNPQAYAKLVKSGALDELDSGQRATLRSAEAAYEERLNRQVDLDWIETEAAILDKISGGEYSPAEGVNQYVLAATDHGRKVTATRGKEIYLAGKAKQEYQERGTAVLVKEAALRGDYKTIAALTEPIMVQAESGGDPNAVSPVGALGTHQVMPATVADPGYGIKPADVTDPKDVARVGKEYWALMVSGSASGYEGLPWEPGDVEAAAIAYNAGPANAKKWIEAGRDYSVLPKREETEPYAKKILKATQEAGILSPESRLQQAEAMLEKTRKLAALEAYEGYQLIQLDLDERLHAGSISDQEYVVLSNTARDTMQIERTKAITEHITSELSSARSNIRAEAEGINKELLNAREAELTNSFEQAMSEVGRPPEYYRGLVQNHIKDIASMYSEQGLTLVDFDYSGLVDHATDSLNKSLDKYDDWSVEQNRIQRAVNTGTLNTLPKNLQNKAFQQVNDHVGGIVSNAVAAGDLSEGDATQQAKLLLEQQYLDIGLVDPQVRLENSAALSGDLVNSQGAVNTQALGVVESYARLLRSNPNVAATFLDQESRVVADAVISAAGGLSSSTLQDGLVRYEQSKSKVGNVFANDLKAQEEARNRIRTAVNGRFGFGGIINRTDVGLAQIIFGDAELGDNRNRTEMDEDYLNSPETSEMLQGWIEAEVNSLARLQPGADPKYLVDAAVQRVTARTDFVGGSFVKMDEGYGIKQQLFGSDLPKLDKADIANEAIVDYLRELGKQPEYSHISEASILQALNPFGKDVDSLLEARAIGAVGVRPFVLVGNGKEVYAQVQLQTGGVSEPIYLDLPNIGKAYKEKYSYKLAGDTIKSDR